MTSRAKRKVLLTTEPSTLGTERIEEAVGATRKARRITNAQLAAIEDANARRHGLYRQDVMTFGPWDTPMADIDALLAEVKLLRSRPITDPHYNAIYDPED